MSSFDRDPDDVVLSYHDSLLRNSDIETLHGCNWLNDQIISFYLEYLEHDRFASAKRRLLFVSPEVTQCLKMLPKSEMSVFLDPLGAPSQSFVFFPLNDHQFDSAGGSHWSLVVFSRPDQKFFYVDSAKGTNLAISKQFAANVCAAIGYEGRMPVCFESVNCPQQKNGYDCGIHVLKNVQTLAKHAISEGNLEDLEGVWPASKNERPRIEIMKLIERLADENR